MKEIQLNLLGAIIVLGGISTLVGTFSPCWINGKFNEYWNVDGCQGTIVTINYGYWLTLAMWLMFGSIVLYLVMFYAVYKARSQILTNGYIIRSKKWFKIITVSSATSTFLTVAAVVITVVHLNTLALATHPTAGYSAWISAGSAGVSVVIFILSTLIQLKNSWNDNVQTRA